MRTTTANIATADDGDNVGNGHAALDWRWWIAASTAVKVLLFPAYRSTDFEVHRNWMAITYALPISQWYFDTGSPWTLDYPPAFAYFEWVLAQLAAMIDAAMVQVSNLEYQAWSVIAYQRASVLVTELMLVWSLRRYFKNDAGHFKHALVFAFAMPGLLLVDHIHFQYNGFLLGLFVWSLAEAKHGRLLASAAVFSALLLFKHIYLYLALPYFVYLLRAYAWPPSNAADGERMFKHFSFRKLAELAAVVLLVASPIMSPFLNAKQLPQLVSRLFPFKRGLIHAYWACNVWALYIFGDRMLGKALSIVGTMSTSSSTSPFSGLVGDVETLVLPNVSPRTTFLLTFATIIYSLRELWHRPTYREFLRQIVLSAFASFMLGWHVHEKAVLLILIPMALYVIENPSVKNQRIFFVLQLAGQYALFPLLFRPEETIIKYCAWLLYSFMVYQWSDPAIMTDGVSWYTFGFAGVSLASWLINTTARFPFLPNLLTSIYCALGAVWAWWAFINKATDPAQQPISAPRVRRNKRD